MSTGQPLYYEEKILVSRRCRVDMGKVDGLIVKVSLESKVLQSVKYGAGEMCLLRTLGTPSTFRVFGTDGPFVL